MKVKKVNTSVGHTNCKYCGAKLNKAHYKLGICTGCYRKLPLVRKLLKMVKDTFEMYGGKDNEKN